MKTVEKTPFLKIERQKTDHSLTAERDKTNESLVNSREDAEKKTDKIVESKRNAADLVISTARTEADNRREDEHKNLRSDEKLERNKSDIRLNEERRESDAATVRERATIDAAITHERDLKNTLVTNLLSQERGLTDQNLKAERSCTDTEVTAKSSLLSEEIAEHSKAKVSITTRDEFLAIVSHDLRNPMGTVSSCAEMLLTDSNYKIDAEVRPWIELMKRNADSALRLIHDILDLERISEGKLGLTLEKRNMNKAIRESIESFTLAASAKNVLLRTVATELPEDTRFDKDRVTQVLSNLIGNALKFTPEGGSIVVQATHKQENSKSELQVCVKDSGPGIPEEKKAFIFDRYAQLKSKDRRGLGLGLYISKMLVEAHNGRIWVESNPGEGSTFYFTIPYVV